MPWNETTPMDQRMQFIADYLRAGLSMTELVIATGSQHGFLKACAPQKSHPGGVPQPEVSLDSQAVAS
jgi:hypothetical protein